MNTITNISKIACTAIGAALLLAVPVGTLASDKSDDIVVSPSAAMQQWQAETTQDLNQALRGGGVRYRGEPNNAIVQITFDLGEDGKAENVQLHNGEGNYFARKIAIRAVKRLDGLDKVPVSDPQDAQFLANIIFANSKDQMARLEERLEDMERARLASAGEDRTYIALGN